MPQLNSDGRRSVSFILNGKPVIGYAEPRWPWHAAAKLGAKLHGPRQYLRAPPNTVKELFHPAAAG